MLLLLGFRRVELILERLLALLPGGVLIEPIGVQGLLHRVVARLALVLPYSDETLHRQLLGRSFLIFFGVTLMLLHRLVLIKLGKKLLVFLILWDAPLLNVKG